MELAEEKYSPMFIPASASLSIMSTLLDLGPMVAMIEVYIER